MSSQHYCIMMTGVRSDMQEEHDVNQMRQKEISFFRIFSWTLPDLFASFASWFQLHYTVCYTRCGVLIESKECFECFQWQYTCNRLTRTLLVRSVDIKERNLDKGSLRTTNLQPFRLSCSPDCLAVCLCDFDFVIFRQPCIWNYLQNEVKSPFRFESWCKKVRYEFIFWSLMTRILPLDDCFEGTI